MYLYCKNTEVFIQQAEQNELAQILMRNFQVYMGHNASPSEVISWSSSLKELALVLKTPDLQQTSIMLEYKLPSNNRRIDVLLLGTDASGQPSGVILELKQWSQVTKGFSRTGTGSTPLETVTVPGMKAGAMLHPSVQAASYLEHLEELVDAFDPAEPEHVKLSACAYLHNAHSKHCGDLFDADFEHVLRQAPVFAGNQKDAFVAHLTARVGHGTADRAIERITNSKLRPSRKLLEHTATMIEGNPVYTLLDEQRVAFDLVIEQVQTLHHTNHKAVVLIKGGPGTGKSVIAMQLLAALAKTNHSVLHATGSKAFTTNLRAQVGNKSAKLFSYFNNFTQLPPNSLDVLVCDEAHRLRETSNSQYTRKDQRSTRTQIEELVDTASVSVFLMDHHQSVRPDEVGTPELVREMAQRKKAEFFELDLGTQFRCGGSDPYLQWLNGIFHLAEPQKPTWGNSYTIEVVDSPEDLESRLRTHLNAGLSARMVAGFCWPWTDPQKDGTLLPDVQIGLWHRPWNRKPPEMCKNKGAAPQPAKHPYTLWATQPEGFDQIGCVYSAQGFEFDYCGVIIGPDLLRREGQWVPNPKASHDRKVKTAKDGFLQLIQHTYRVLLSRGMKGTYIYCSDPETRAFFARAALEADTLAQKMEILD